MDNFQITFASEESMQRWLQANAAAFACGLICYLDGDLGAGKTSFCRSLLHALGHTGRVKSPTYTLLEVYGIQSFTVCHFDLYRLGDPEELSYLGADDYDDGASLWLVEWPDRGRGFLPIPDLEIRIDIGAAGRDFSFIAHTENGANVCKRLRD